MFFRALLAALSFLQLVAPLRGDSVLSLPTAQTDATEFGSLALDPSESLLLPPGTFRISTQASYFNQWSGSWHTARLREASGAGRTPVTEAEIRGLDEQFPGEKLYRVDVEGWRFDTLLAFGLRGLTLSARIPWIGVGVPSGDSVAEAFHQIVPVNDAYDREFFARGETLVVMRSDAGAITRLSGLDRKGFGDIVATIAMPVARTPRTAHVAALSVSAPTGERGTLHGSGGWDAGVRWFSNWSGGRRQYVAAAGWSRLDPHGDFLGVRRSDVWNLYAAVEHPLGRNWAASLRGRIDSSPLARYTSEDPGRPSIYYRLGVHRRVGSSDLVSVEFGDEIAPQWGTEADWSLHLAFTHDFAR